MSDYGMTKDDSKKITEYCKRAKGFEYMNHEKIPDPTADLAVYRADKQRRLEKLHGVKVGESITIWQCKNEDGGIGKKNYAKKKKIKIVILGIYDNYVRCLLPWGYCESYTWWAFDRMRRGDANGPEGRE